MKQIISKNFIESLQKYEDMFRDEVKVGYPRPSVPYPDSEATVADVAMWNEFGVPGRIPARPFFRTAWNSFKAGMKGVLEKSIDAFKKEKYAKPLEFAAIMFVDEVQNQITAGSWTPNNPATIAKKGSSRPLMDTGKLAQSVQVWRDE